MSFRLPLSGTPAREACGDMATLAAILNPANIGKMPVTWQARKSAVAFLEANPAAKRVNTVVIRAENDERWLISFGPRGGWKKVWNFGTGRN